MSAPDDSQTAEEARAVHPLYGARMARLAALQASLRYTPAQVDTDDDSTMLAIEAGLQRVRRGTR